MNQRGFTPALIILVIVLVIGSIGGAYYLGKKSDTSLLTQSNLIPVSSDSPKVTTITTSPEIADWVLYKSKILNMEFKLPPNLANRFGKLIEQETKGERGSQVQISFVNDSKSLIITAQSPEYDPIPEPIPSMTEQEARDASIGGPPIVTPHVFQGFKYVNGLYYGLLSFGQFRELPLEQVTQYHTNGRDLLKVKTLYSDYGMARYQTDERNSQKIWGIINGTSNLLYQGVTIQGVLSTELTDQVFERILSTFI